MTTDNPSLRRLAVVHRDELYSLQELRHRLGWAEHAMRQARVAGLKTILFGSKKYVLGSDVLDFFERLKTGGPKG